MKEAIMCHFLNTQFYANLLIGEAKAAQVVWPQQVHSIRTKCKLRFLTHAQFLSLKNRENKRNVAQLHLYNISSDPEQD